MDPYAKNSFSRINIGDTWNAKVGSQETPGVTGKFGLGNLQGMQLKQVKADGTTIQMPLMNNQVYILKVGKETIKVK